MKIVADKYGHRTQYDKLKAELEAEREKKREQQMLVADEKMLVAAEIANAKKEREQKELDAFNARRKRIGGPVIQREQ